MAKEKESSKPNWFQIFKQGVVTGLGTAVGATLGFAIISTIVVAILNAAGGLPLVGNWIAGIVEATNAALGK